MLKNTKIIITGAGMGGQMMTIVMDLGGAKVGAGVADELCNDVCPFGIKKCVDLCKQLLEAIGTCVCIR